MRKLALILAVAGLLCLAQASQAADLQAGWYVKLGGVALFGIDPTLQQQVGIDWSFVGGLGDWGPFAVTEPDGSWVQRVIAVPGNAYGIASGTKVDLTGTPLSAVNFIPDTLQFAYGTFYDVTQMRFDLYSQHSDGTLDKLYSETRSGQHTVAPTITLNGRYNPAADSLIFRTTTVVPEPASIIPLALAIVCASAGRRRRTK